MDKESKIKVALIDDNELLRHAIRQYLESFGFELLWEAGHGQEALDNLQSIEPFPEICIVDINMPVMDGFHTVATLRHRYPIIKLIVFSVNDDYENLARMLNYRIEGYLLKGADPAELETAVRAIHSGKEYFSETIQPLVERYLWAHKRCR